MYNKALFYIPSYIPVSILPPFSALIVLCLEKKRLNVNESIIHANQSHSFFSFLFLGGKYGKGSTEIPSFTASWYWVFYTPGEGGRRQEVKVEPATASLILQKLFDCDGYSYRNDAAEFHIRLAGVENARSSVWIYNCRDEFEARRHRSHDLYSSCISLLFVCCCRQDAEPRIQKLYTINSKMNHCHYCCYIACVNFKQNQSIRVILDWCLYKTMSSLNWNWYQIASQLDTYRTSFNMLTGE